MLEHRDHVTGHEAFACACYITGIMWLGMLGHWHHVVGHVRTQDPFLLSLFLHKHPFVGDLPRRPTSDNTMQAATIKWS